MAENVIAADELEARLVAAPFNAWMGLRILSCTEDGIEIGMTWREEMISNPRLRITHGGIIGALIDVAADYAVAAKLGVPAGPRSTSGSTITAPPSPATWWPRDGWSVSAAPTPSPRRRSTTPRTGWSRAGAGSISPPPPSPDRPPALKPPSGSSTLDEAGVKRRDGAG